MLEHKSAIHAALKPTMKVKSHKTSNNPISFYTEHQENANNDILKNFLHPLNTSAFTDRIQATSVFSILRNVLAQHFFLLSEDISVSA